MSKQKRLYLGNLPPDVSESAIRKYFRLFGKINSVDIRTKKGDEAGYAFVDVETSDTVHLQSAVGKYNDKEWNGFPIKVQFAKESFLSRLEKERKETSVKITKADMKIEEETIQTNGFVDSDTEDEKDIPMFPGTKAVLSPQLKSPSPKKNISKIVLKNFEDFSDFWKDSPSTNKTVTNETPSKNNSESRKFLTKNEKHVADDSKRLASIKEKMNTLVHRQRLVKQALSSLDGSSTAKKIVFKMEDDSNVDVDVEEPNMTNYEGGKMSLFQDSDDEQIDENEIGIKRQFEGKKGKKLLDLQAKINLDERFKLDERFIESDEETAASREEEPLVEDDFENEKKHQLDLLEQVLGHPLSHSISKPVKAIPMFRYDPTKLEHKQLLNKNNLEENLKSKEKNKLKGKLINDGTTTSTAGTATTTTEKFFQVEETITESFKKSDNEGFSLLQMFGRDDRDERVASEEEIPQMVPFKRTVPMEEDESVEESRQTSAPLQGLFKENLFYKSNDPRLQDGLDFLNKKDSEEAKKREENYPNIRTELKAILRFQLKRNLRRNNPFKKKIGGGKKFALKRHNRRR